MTDLKERLERLQAASDSVDTPTMESLMEQAKKAAANMLQLYGAKSCLDAGGFIFCIQNAHEASLLYLLDEGFVELTEKGRASDDTIEQRQRRRQEAADAATAEAHGQDAAPEPLRNSGAYL